MRTGVVGVPDQQLDPAHGVEQRLPADDQPVGVVGRDQLAVVGELALDQPGGQPDVLPISKVASCSPSRRMTAGSTPSAVAGRCRAAAAVRPGPGTGPAPSGPRSARPPRAGPAPPAGRSRSPPAAGRRPRPPSARRSGSGRLSSLEAARTTWRRASARPTAGRVTGAPVGAGRRGKSAAGWVRTANCDRPEVMRSSSSSASTLTAPGSRARMMSVTSRPGCHGDAVTHARTR